MRLVILGVVILLSGLNASRGEETDRVIVLPEAQTLRLLPVTSASAMLNGVTFKVPMRELVLTDALGKPVWVDFYPVDPMEPSCLHAAALLDAETLAVICRHQDSIQLYVYQHVAGGWGRIQQDRLDLAMDPVRLVLRGVNPPFDHAELPHVTFERNKKGKVRVIFPSGQRLPLRRAGISLEGRVRFPGPDED